MKVGVIGGTGLADFAGISWRHEEVITTSFGDPSAAIRCGKINGVDLLFLPRHGPGHSIAPHRINYRANIAALQQMGATAVFSVNAVGGITESMAPGAVVIPDQIIDYSYGRETTFFDGVGAPLDHVDFSLPYSESLRRALVNSAGGLLTHFVSTGVYGCTQGPRLETAAEIQRLKRDGCDLVGMTGMPEAVLAREAGIEYASICLVVNWGAGLTETPISMDEIHQVVEVGMVDVKALLLSTLKKLAIQ